MPTVHVSVADVLEIRRALAQSDIGLRDAFGSCEPLYPDRLEMAVNRQNTGFGDEDKYGSVREVAATLFYGLAMNHAFDNGNKRTALVTLLVFLDRTEFMLVDTDEDELYTLVTDLVEHKIALNPGEKRTSDTEVAAVARWLRPRIRPVGAGDRNVTFRELKALLEAQGCTFEAPDQNFVKIRRGSHSVKIGYPRHNFDIAVNQVKRIRERLKLDDLNTNEFYNTAERVASFVERYRKLIERLADM